MRFAGLRACYNWTSALCRAHHPQNSFCHFNYLPPKDWRIARHFEATLGAGGVTKAKAQLDGGNSMDVKGTIKDGESRIILDGYCKFDAKLTKK